MKFLIHIVRINQSLLIELYLMNPNIGALLGKLRNYRYFPVSPPNTNCTVNEKDISFVQLLRKIAKLGIILPLVLLFCVTSHSNPEKGKNSLTIIVTGNESGYVEPCG